MHACSHYCLGAKGMIFENVEAGVLLLQYSRSRGDGITASRGRWGRSRLVNPITPLVVEPLLKQPVTLQIFYF